MFDLLPSEAGLKNCFFILMSNDSKLAKSLTWLLEQVFQKVNFRPQTDDEFLQAIHIPLNFPMKVGSERSGVTFEDGVAGKAAVGNVDHILDFLKVTV